MELAVIQSKIFIVRTHRVMFDFHLAELYGVKTKALKQSVRRNIDRFPLDFMFELTDNEWKELVTNCDQLPKTIRFSTVSPMAFTEQGVAMLSSVLKSQQAIEINIAIMRTFVQCRQYNLWYEELKRRIEENEKENNSQFNHIDEQLEQLYAALTNLYVKEEDKKERKPIGYIIPSKSNNQ